ncbi:phenylalanine--tRNA ligase subunit beta [Gammaproteobacteria bacterium]|nr:phenylalanine--tRNA ligase subunit beta [Gammaproteobacteria bacterium]
MEILSDKLFQLGHEHEVEGNIFNMEFTPNRGDCLSINGLLRDLSVFYEVNNFYREIYNEEIEDLQLDFKNLSQDVCPQISFLKLEIDNIPDAYTGCLNDYFLDLNLNKNNFFTDVSNYISYETGQPTHCYNADKINGSLIFQELNINEEFETLLDKKINLTKKNSVFLLENEIINLAGVIGGKTTACSSKTKTVLLECAYFKPEAVIGKSLKYDIQSDASHKFERSVDPKCHNMVIRRFINIVSEQTKIKDISSISYKFKDTKFPKIPFDIIKINQILGTNISKDEYLNYLFKLGFALKDSLIMVPSHRSDIATQNDLAEEVARIIGYNNIIKNQITIPKRKVSNNHDIEKKLRYFLLDQGFYEVINSPFVSNPSKDSIKVINPLDSNRQYLRTNITESLVDSLIFNERRQKDSIKLFEISDVYTSKNNEIKKTKKLSIIASGRVGNNYEDFSKKIDKSYLQKIFNKAMPNNNLNFQVLVRDSLNTKIKNDIVVCEVDISNFSDDIFNVKTITKSPDNFAQYNPISDLPCSKRDLSFSIKDHTKCKSLEEFILSFKDELIKEIFIFDYYNNKEKQQIKLGFRFIFQSKDRTITDKEVDNIMNTIISRALEYESVSIPGLAQDKCI